MKNRTLVIFALVLLALLSAACADTGTQKDELSTDWQLQRYQAVQPLHLYTYSWERWIVQTIYDFRITKLSSTWAVWVGDGTGEPIDMCAAKGYGIPYSTSITNQWQVVYSGGATISLMEPNGLYPSGNTLATWVLCVEPDGSLHPQYVEPQVIVYDHPVAIAFDGQRGMYRIVRAGDPTYENAIVPPTNINPALYTGSNADNLNDPKMP